MDQDFRSTYASSRSAPQPQLGLLIDLAGADLVVGVLALQFLGVIELAATQQLHDVPAVLGVEGLGDLIDLQARPPPWRSPARRCPAVVQSRSPPSAAEPASCELTCASGREILAAEDALADVFELQFDGGVILQLIGVHQDMAHVDLLHDVASSRRLRTSLRRTMWKPVGARIGRADFAGLQIQHGIRQHGRQLGALAPAQFTAVQGRLAVGIGDRELREVLAGLGALIDLIRLLLRRFQLRRRGLLRHGDQDVRDVVLGVGGRVVRLAIQVLVDFARGDGDACHHVALLQQAQREFAAHGVAVGGVVDALGRQRLRQLLQRNAIALRDFGQGVVQGLIGDLEAGAVGALHLGFLHDQVLDDLLAHAPRPGASAGPGCAGAP